MCVWGEGFVDKIAWGVCNFAECLLVRVMVNRYAGAAGAVFSCSSAHLEWSVGEKFLQVARWYFSFTECWNMHVLFRCREALNRVAIGNVV